MRQLACLCFALSTTTVSAQQTLYAGNARGDLVEIVDYDSTATACGSTARPGTHSASI